MTWHQWHHTATRSSSTSFFSAFARSKTWSDHGCQSIAGSAATAREIAQTARSESIDLEHMGSTCAAHEKRARCLRIARAFGCARENPICHPEPERCSWDLILTQRRRGAEKTQERLPNGGVVQTENLAPRPLRLCV